MLLAILLGLVLDANALNVNQTKKIGTLENDLTKFEKRLNTIEKNVETKINRLEKLLEFGGKKYEPIITYPGK